MITDISKQKEVERVLKEREKELEQKTNYLEELNAALKVLLKRREEDKRELEQNVVSNQAVIYTLLQVIFRIGAITFFRGAEQYVVALLGDFLIESEQVPRKEVMLHRVGDPTQTSTVSAGVIAHRWEVTVVLD